MPYVRTGIHFVPSLHLGECAVAWYPSAHCTSLPLNFARRIKFLMLCLTCVLGSISYRHFTLVSVPLLGTPLLTVRHFRLLCAMAFLSQRSLLSACAHKASRCGLHYCIRRRHSEHGGRDTRLPDVGTGTRGPCLDHPDVVCKIAEGEDTVSTVAVTRGFQMWFALLQKATTQ